jgi:5-methylcytosine-specific restriction endonuclease McrA
MMMTNRNKIKPSCKICQGKKKLSPNLSYENIKKSLESIGFTVLESSEEFSQKTNERRRVKIVCKRGHVTNREAKEVYHLGVCKKCYLEDYFEGEKNRFYKHGKSHDNLTERQKENSIGQKWRRRVLRLKGCKCDICKTKEKIHAHHINSYDWDTENRFNPENGIPICEKHHWEFHNRYGRGGNTASQYEEFKKRKAVDFLYEEMSIFEF